MTALGTSRVWTTSARGILNEIYWPAVDQPQVKDFGFLVAGNGWWREVKREATYDLTVDDPGVALPTVVHRCSDPAHELTLRVVVHPERDAVLIGYELGAGDVGLHPLIAPHLAVCQPTDPDRVAQLGADTGLQPGDFRILVTEYELWQSDATKEYSYPTAPDPDVPDQRPRLQRTLYRPGTRRVVFAEALLV
jgi:glucoamylase